MKKSIKSEDAPPDEWFAVGRVQSFVLVGSTGPIEGALPKRVRWDALNDAEDFE